MASRPNRLETCPRCKVPYPPELLSALQTNDDQPIRRVCGICALELINKVHGTQRTEFHGQQAEWMRLDAIEWRKRQQVKA